MNYGISLVGISFPLPSAPIARVDLPGKGSASAFFELLPFTPLGRVSFPFPFQHLTKVSVFVFPFGCYRIVMFIFGVSIKIPTGAASPPEHPTFNPVSVAWSTTDVVSLSYSAAVARFPVSQDSFGRLVEHELSH